MHILSRTKYLVWLSEVVSRTAALPTDGHYHTEAARRWSQGPLSFQHCSMIYVLSPMLIIKHFSFVWVKLDFEVQMFMNGPSIQVSLSVLLQSHLCCFKLFFSACKSFIKWRLSSLMTKEILQCNCELWHRWKKSKLGNRRQKNQKGIHLKSCFLCNLKR